MTLILSASNEAGVRYSTGNAAEMGFAGFLMLAAVIAVVGSVVWLQLWSQRRRRRGEEASSSNGDGAEGLFVSMRDMFLG